MAGIIEIFLLKVLILSYLGANNFIRISTNVSLQKIRDTNVFFLIELKYSVVCILK